MTRFSTRTRLAVAFALLCSPRCAPLQAQQVPTWKATEMLRIDGDEKTFSQIYMLLVYRDGSIAVLPGEPVVLWYDANGRAKGKFGREGEGPGEFRFINYAGLIGDTLWVNDFSLRRTTFIAPNRKLLRSERWPLGIGVATPAGRTSFPAPLGLAPRVIYADGDRLADPLLPPLMSHPSWYPKERGSLPIIRLDTAGNFKKLLAVTPGMGPCNVFYNGPNSVGTPFCASNLSEIAADGSRILFVMQQNREPLTPSYRIVTIGATGDTLLSRQYSYAPVPMSRAMADSAMLVLRTPSKHSQPQPGRSDAIDALVVAKTVPPVVRLLAGRDGTTWVAEGGVGAERSWLILDARGDQVARVKLPRSFVPRVADGSQLWGIDSDDDGLQRVVRYRIGPGN
ncbi:MAG: hypothetical protein ABIZ70_10990 [Gemmatimonadales bacterium]